jgi:chemotaxis protein MotB
VAGFAHTMPVSRNDTAEGRAYNRRVDIIILDEGHL